MIVEPRLKNLSNRTGLGPLLHELGLTGKFVEVGSLYGDHAADILKKWSGHLYCVDLWRNQPGEDYFDGANKLNMNAVFVKASAVLKGPRCTLLRMSSMAGSGKFEDGELDGVYLDANHRLSAIRSDILAWWPKVKVGGVFSGHDFNTRYDHETDSDALTAVMELSEAIGVRVHVTWCTSWFFIKTAEADAAFRKWNLGTGPTEPPAQPVYSDNANIELVTVMPVAKFDWNLAVKNLTWIRALGGEEQVVAYCSPELNAEQLAMLAGRAEVAVASHVKESGYFGTPNQMFKGALEYVEKHHPGHAMLWVEADAIPLHPAWLDAIADEYRRCGRPFMGDVYRQGELPHGTGNAVYHPQWRKYAPSLTALGCEEQGWDSICAFDTLPRWHPAARIQQIWRPPLPITKGWWRENIWDTTVLFHQCKDGSLIDVLCDEDGLDKIPLLPALCESTYLTQKRKEVVEPINWVDDTPVATRYQPPVPIPATPGSVAILVVTYSKDIEFLRYCLKSIEKYASGFSGVTIAVPEHERGLFDWVKRAEVVYFPEPAGKGMLMHMAMKCRADELCPSVSAIWHLDPDCILWAKVTPADLYRGDKPVLVRERFADIKNPNRLLWQKNVERALGFKPEYECMVRHGQLHLRDVYAKTRELVEAHTGQGFDAFVCSGQNTFPQSFAEWPTVGAVAIAHFRDRYACVDYNPEQDARECGLPADTRFQYIYRRGRDPLCECWSHGGIDRYRSDIEAWLNGKTPSYFVK